MGNAPDFHVVSLKYSLKRSETCTYQNAPERAFETQEARFRLANDELTCEMKTHFPTPDAARDVVEPTIRAWEIDADLRWGKGELCFEFSGADVIDRTPLQPGEGRAVVASLQPLQVTAGFGVSAHVTRNHYPDPPPNGFVLNTDAKEIYDRYCRYRDGREPLAGMAYYCLTLLEKKFTPPPKRREQAAVAYKIELPIFENLGRLTSEHSDGLNTRKAYASNPLTATERAWIESAMKKLIWQVGTRSADRNWVRMSDLPPL